MSWNDEWPKDGDNWGPDGGQGAGSGSGGDGGWGQPRRRRRGPIIALVAVLAVVVFGGLLLMARGRGDGDEPAPTPVTSATAMATPPATGAATPDLTPTPAPLPAAPISGDAPTTPSEAAVTVFPFEAPIYTLALELINESRREAGLSAVAWDSVAAEAGRRHVVEMVEWGYFSHWNLEGLGPEHRYSRAGGANAVSENLHARASVRPPTVAADWETVIREAHVGLMDSPGHRANILDPTHTHVGIAIAYDQTAGQMRLAQEFTNQYVSLNRWLPLSAERGATLQLDGSAAGSLDNLLLDLAWEPLPQPLSVEALNQTQTYTSAAQSYDTTRLEAAFSRDVVLDNAGRPGIYHIRIFADVNGQQALLVDRAVWVE